MKNAATSQTFQNSSSFQNSPSFPTFPTFQNSSSFTIISDDEEITVISDSSNLRYEIRETRKLPKGDMVIRLYVDADNVISSIEYDGRAVLHKELNYSAVIYAADIIKFKLNVDIFTHNAVSVVYKKDSLTVEQTCQLVKIRTFLLNHTSALHKTNPFEDYI